MGLNVPCDDLGWSVPESGWTVSVALPCKTWVDGVRGVCPVMTRVFEYVSVYKYVCGRGRG